LVPTITFWFVAGIFGLTTFILTRPAGTPPVRILILGMVISATIAILTGFYCKVAYMLRDYIEVIHKTNLPKVERQLAQCAKRLGESEAFVYKGDSGNDKVLKVRQAHIPWLIGAVCFVGLSAALLVLIWSIVQYYVGHATPETGAASASAGLIAEQTVQPEPWAARFLKSILVGRGPVNRRL
jgi:hypothetical protein